MLTSPNSTMQQLDAVLYATGKSLRQRICTLVSNKSNFTTLSSQINSINITKSKQRSKKLRNLQKRNLRNQKLWSKMISRKLLTRLLHRLKLIEN